MTIGDIVLTAYPNMNRRCRIAIIGLQVVAVARVVVT